MYISVERMLSSTIEVRLMKGLIENCQHKSIGLRAGFEIYGRIIKESIPLHEIRSTKLDILVGRWGEDF